MKTSKLNYTQLFLAVLARKKRSLSKQIFEVDHPFFYTILFKNAHTVSLFCGTVCLPNTIEISELIHDEF